MERFKPAPKIKQTPKGKAPNFAKGNNANPKGRPKGPNRIPRIFAECVELTTRIVGRPEPMYLPKMKKDGTVLTKNGKPVLTNTIIGYKSTGKDGTVGYMEWLALYEPKAFVQLMLKTMPTQITATASVEHTVTSKFEKLDTSKMTLAELNAAFREVVGMTKHRTIAPPQSSMLIEGTVNETVDEETA